MQKHVQTEGVHHVGLTVAELEPTRRFFVDVLGFEVVGERPEYPAVFVSDGTVMLTLWRAENGQDARPFDRKRSIGLHHLALRIANGTTLDALYRDLRQADHVAIEFGPEPLGATGLEHLMCTIAGGIRLELVGGGAS